MSCTRDRARIKDEAHRLKGAAETFGLCQLSELAKTLECLRADHHAAGLSRLCSTGSMRCFARVAPARRPQRSRRRSASYLLCHGRNVTPNQFRRIALSLPGASEGAHMGTADFRVGAKIFATLGNPDAAWGVIGLTPDQQALLIETTPDVFVAVPGGWGDARLDPRPPRRGG